MANAAQIREKINKQIIAALEKGVPPWIRPWRNDPEAAKHGGRHHNFISKRPYRGVNPLLLEMESMSRGFTSTAWGTFDQWKKFDCHVRKGEKSTWVVFWKLIPANKVPADEGEDHPKGKMIPLLRYFWLFNACQVEGNSEVAEEILRRFRPGTGQKPEAVAPALPPDYATAEKIIQACKDDGLKITHGGNRAAWANGTDNIRMPKPDQFPTPSHYFETLFHETGHWTELERHTNWDRAKWGYAMGELRAELICCYLRQHSNIPAGESLENHTAYIKSWLEQMRKDDQWIFRATRFADEGANCILKLAGMYKEVTEHEHEGAGPEPLNSEPATTTRQRRGRKPKASKAA